MKTTKAANLKKDFHDFKMKNDDPTLRFRIYDHVTGRHNDVKDVYNVKPSAKTLDRASGVHRTVVVVLSRGFWYVDPAANVETTEFYR